MVLSGPGCELVRCEAAEVRVRPVAVVVDPPSFDRRAPGKPQRDPHRQSEALEIMRSLIEQVIVHPREGGGFEVELVGEIASMVEVAMGGERKNAALGGAALDAGSRRSVKVVAGTGFEPVTFRL